MPSWLFHNDGDGDVSPDHFEIVGMRRILAKFGASSQPTSTMTDAWICL